LVTAGERKRDFAALVDVGGTPLSLEEVQVGVLTIVGDAQCPATAFLCPISETRVLMYSNKQDGMWYCDITGTLMTLKKLSTTMPASQGFCAVPLRLPDGELLVAGARPWSRQLTLLSVDEEPTFKVIGNISGRARCYASTILLGERLVVGFGGYNGAALDDLWIFDIQTRKSCQVGRYGEWPSAAWSVPMTVRGGSLYIFGWRQDQEIHSITFTDLFELIPDDAIRTAFYSSLDLWRTIHRVYPRQDSYAVPGMKLLGNDLPDLRSYNTVTHKGRTFHFTQGEGKLFIYELIIGQRISWIRTSIYPNRPTELGGPISCCSLGDSILVMSSQGRDVFATLLTVENGGLRRGSVHSQELRVEGNVIVPDYLVRLAERTSVAFCHGEGDAWLCHVNKTALVMEKLTLASPDHEFRCLPLVLPGKRLVVAGGWASSPDVTVVSLTDKTPFKRVGTIPGEVRYCASSVLVGRAFLVGFGGYSNERLDDLWIFDLETSRSSVVKKSGEWHPAASWPFMEVRDDVLYIIGGKDTASAHSISLPSLAELVKDQTLQKDFRRHLLSALPQGLAMARSGLQGAWRDISLLEEELRNVSEGRALSSWARRRLGVRISEKLVPAKGGALWGLREVTSRSDGVFVRLPFAALPAVSFPHGWRVDAPGLERFRVAAQTHEAGLPQRQSFIAEYTKVFRPLLDESLPRRFFSARGITRVASACDHSIFQVANSLIPGQLFPLSCSLRPLARLYPLRPEGKLLDSTAAVRAVAVLQKKFRSGENVPSLAPPSYRLLLSILDAQDPLQTERSHISSTRLRRVVQTARIPRMLGKQSGEGGGSKIDEAVNAFQKMKGAADRGYENEGWTDSGSPDGILVSDEPEGAEEPRVGISSESVASTGLQESVQEKVEGRT